MKESLNEVIKNNEKMIYALARNFKNYTNKDDLYQVGCIGLIKAYYKFDSSYNVKFSTYAYPYIFGEMKKYVREDRELKISRDITKFNLRIEKASILLTQKLKRVPSIKEISDYLELDEKYIVDAFRSRNSVMSLDEPVNTDGKEISPYDLIADEKSHDIDALIDLRNELAKLSDIDREIINERYHKDYTQSKVASNLGMSQVQVSRLESKILKRLKHNLTH
jgi:RNA polymerase sporulation-specific sigma factor